MNGRELSVLIVCPGFLVAGKIVAQIACYCKRVVARGAVQKRFTSRAPSVDGSIGLNQKDETFVRFLVAKGLRLPKWCVEGNAVDLLKAIICLCGATVRGGASTGSFASELHGGYRRRGGASDSERRGRVRERASPRRAEVALGG